MKLIKVSLTWLIGLFALITVLLLFAFCCQQECFLFHPQKLSKDYQFTYPLPFEEINIEVDKDITINGLLFTCDSTKGLVFYLHGNVGQLDTWGSIAQLYIDLHYDVFVMDYRGYGKSDGEIVSEQQLHHDVSIVYKQLMKRYKEENTIVVGYSIGSGMATYLAANNNPKALILKAPYSNLKDLIHHYFPLIPNSVIKYPLPTDNYIKEVKAPIIIFHGDNDELIPYENALLLSNNFKKGDTLVQLPNQGHLDLDHNPLFINTIHNLLSN